MPKAKKTKKSSRKASTRKPATTARPGRGHAAKRTPETRGPSRKSGVARISWLDERTQLPQIETRARQLKSFMAALADGIVDERELHDQQRRLVTLMKEIEPQLDDALHARVSELLCEMTAYDLMQVLHSLHQSRPTSRFRG